MEFCHRLFAIIFGLFTCAISRTGPPPPHRSDVLPDDAVCCKEGLSNINEDVTVTNGLGLL